MPKLVERRPQIDLAHLARRRARVPRLTSKHPKRRQPMVMPFFAPLITEPALLWAGGRKKKYPALWRIMVVHEAAFEGNARRSTSATFCR